MLEVMAKNGERDPGHGDRQSQKAKSQPATQLSGLGLTKSDSSRWQELKHWPELEFEAYIASGLADALSRWRDRVAVIVFGREHVTPDVAFGERAVRGDATSQIGISSLKTLGLTLNDSSRWQQLKDWPEPEFDAS